MDITSKVVLRSVTVQRNEFKKEKESMRDDISAIVFELYELKRTKAINNKVFIKCYNYVLSNKQSFYNLCKSDLFKTWSSIALNLTQEVNHLI